MLINSILRKFTFSKLLRAPRVISILVLMKISSIFCDEIYLKILFRLKLGYKLDFSEPRTYNEKLQWLKLNYRRPVMNIMVDKFEAKKYVAKVIGEEYIVPTLGIWDSYDKIDFDKLPNQFVLKTTHDQGGVVICRNKNNFDYKEAKKIINKHLKTKHYFLSREWPYKNVKPRILAEKYMVDESNIELKDYKFFCFDGKVKAMFIATERQSGKEVKFNFFDRDFNNLNIIQIHPQSKKIFEKPNNYEKMIELSELLSTGFPHIRVDFYNINGDIYFGEFTFFHHGGLVSFHPDKWDNTFGSWIDINLHN